MEVHFTPELQARLDQAAAENHRAPGDYVQQLVETYIEHDSWFRRKVTTSLKRLDSGEFLTHEEIGERIEKLLQP
jgi:predicted transcriptional regulator